jgi:hypothetical protein
MHRRPVLVGNVSGSTGDRLDGKLRRTAVSKGKGTNLATGLKSMLRGPTKIDVIMGDWMSEVSS